MSELLSSSVPVPAELEAAWIWMEEQGHGLDTSGGYYLTAYPGERQLGPVFDARASLEGWFEDGQLPPDRLVPVAQISGDGGIGALWLDDAGAVRVVALADGGYVLADNAVDFLRLLAIGYDEFST